MVKKKPVKVSKPRTKLTIKQQRFVDNYTQTGNATEAASKAYKAKNRTSASAIGTENLGKPLIVQSIEERLKKCKDEMYVLAFTAEKDSDRIKALQDTIDRIEGRAKQRIEGDFDGNFSINIVNYGGTNNTT